MYYALAGISVLTSLMLTLVTTLYKRIIFPQRMSALSPLASLTNFTGILHQLCRTVLLVYPFYVSAVTPSPPST